MENLWNISWFILQGAVISIKIIRGDNRSFHSAGHALRDGKIDQIYAAAMAS